MNADKADRRTSHALCVANAMEWNVLQVAIDEIIEDLEDALLDEDPDPGLRQDIEERLNAANALKEKLSDDFA